MRYRLRNTSCYPFSCRSITYQTGDSSQWRSSAASSYGRLKYRDAIYLASVHHVAHEAQPLENTAANRKKPDAEYGEFPCPFGRAAAAHRHPLAGRRRPCSRCRLHGGWLTTASARPCNSVCGSVAQSTHRTRIYGPPGRPWA